MLYFWKHFPWRPPSSSTPSTDARAAPRCAAACDRAPARRPCAALKSAAPPQSPQQRPRRSRANARYEVWGLGCGLAWLGLGFGWGWVRVGWVVVRVAYFCTSISVVFECFGMLGLLPVSWQRRHCGTESCARPFPQIRRPRPRPRLQLYYTNSTPRDLECSEC